MTRLDLLPENDLATTIANAERSVEQLKTSQVTGFDSNKLYLGKTAQSYDMSGSIAANTYGSFQIENNFVVQDFGMMYIYVEVYRNSPYFSNKMLVGDSGMRDLFLGNAFTDPSNPKHIASLVEIYNDSSTANYYIKMYYVTSDKLVGFTYE